MKISVCQTGSLRENCYLIEDEAAKCAWVVDPGDEPDKIRAMVKERGVIPEAILITHAHFDHVGAAGELAEVWDCPIRIAQAEAEDIREGGAFRAGHIKEIYEHFYAVLQKRGQYAAAGDEEKLGGQRWQVLCVPGHSPASLCYYNEKDGVLLSGDTLFRGSVGRTDVYAGSSEDLLRNIRQTLMALPDATVVLPGHGPATTIGRERTENPYLQA